MSKRRENIKNVKDARAIITNMEEYLNSGDDMAIQIADAFFYMFSHHLHEGDLRPNHVLMAALLRKGMRDE